MGTECGTAALRAPAVFFLPPQPSSASTIQNDVSGDLPGGPVVKNPPAGAGGAGWIPGPGRLLRPRGN